MQRMILVAALLVGIQGWADGGYVISAANCRHTVDNLNCVKFIKNYDGDTVTVNIPSVHPIIGELITVRVDGIDSPEMDSSNACERRAAVRAQQLTEEMLANAKRIDLKQSKRDKYFRVLADIRADGKSVSKRLLDERLAVPYDGGHKDDVDWCRH